MTDSITDIPQNIKRCTKCGETKDASAFSKRTGCKCGLQSQCKSCAAKYSAQWLHDHAEEHAQYNAQWRQEHRKEIAEWRQVHPQYQTQWKKDNPEKRRAYQHHRRAIKAENGGMHTAADVKRQGDSQNWKCWWRGPGCAIDCRDKYHVDHLVPLGRGGHNNPSNIVISCEHCNTSKGAKMPDEFCGRLL